MDLSGIRFAMEKVLQLEANKAADKTYNADGYAQVLFCLNNSTTYRFMVF